MHIAEFRVAKWACALLTLVFVASARGVEPADAASQSAAYLLAADAEVHLRLLESVASNTHTRGDRFSLEVVEPVLVDGAIVIPAGTRGEGEVVHAAKGGFGGRAGELIMVSRFVQIGDQQVKLRSFSAGSGQDRVNLAMGLSYVVVGMFVVGKEIALPVGTDVFAKVATDTLFSSALTTESGPVDSASASIPNQTSAEIQNNELSQQ